MRNLSGQLLPVLNYAGPLACGDCGGPANQPSAGISRAEQRGDWGWRVCVNCDHERSQWNGRGLNPLAALVADIYDPVSALAVREFGPEPYRVLTPYSNEDKTEPTDDPHARWAHVSWAVLDRVVERSAKARWSREVDRALG